MTSETVHLETEKDYDDLSAKTVQWCKENVAAARNNPALGSRYSSKIKAKLFSGIMVKDTKTLNTALRRFDYSTEYILNVMQPNNRTWNKWIILCALEYTEEYNEFEDMSSISVTAHSNTSKTDPVKKGVVILASRQKLKKG